MPNLFDFEKRMGKNAPFIKNPDSTISTHKMAWGSDDKGYYAFPTIINRNGKLEELSPKDADAYARQTGELKRFNTQAEAQAYAAGSWKDTKKEQKMGMFDFLKSAAKVHRGFVEGANPQFAQAQASQRQAKSQELNQQLALLRGMPKGTPLYEKTVNAILQNPALAGIKEQIGSISPEMFKGADKYGTKPWYLEYLPKDMWKDAAQYTSGLLARPLADRPIHEQIATIGAQLETTEDENARRILQTIYNGMLKKAEKQHNIPPLPEAKEKPKRGLWDRMFGEEETQEGLTLDKAQGIAKGWAGGGTQQQAQVISPQAPPVKDWQMQGMLTPEMRDERQAKPITPESWRPEPSRPEELPKGAKWNYIMKRWDNVEEGIKVAYYPE